MPRCFNFIDRKTGNPVNLATIDDLIRNDLGIPADPAKYCDLYRLITLMGICSVVQDDSGKVDAAKLDKYLTDKQPELDPKERAIVMKYLAEDYIFSAWWETK